MGRGEDDLEEEKSWWAQKQAFMARIVDSSVFEFTTGMLILLNIASRSALKGHTLKRLRSSTKLLLQRGMAW